MSVVSFRRVNYNARVFHFWKLPLLVACPWRLVPELDGFDDRHCEAFARRVVGVRAAGLLLALPIALVVGMSITMLGSVVADRLPDRVTSREVIPGRGLAIVFGVAMIAVTVTIALTPYCVLIRSALRRHIARAACPSCGYSLMGLPLLARVAYGPSAESAETEDDQVICPECGMVISLTSFGLGRDDIIAGALLPSPHRTPISASIRRRLLMARVAGACVVILALGWVVTGWDGWVTAIVPVGAVLAGGLGLAFKSDGLRA